jgi:hypothetical protein
VAEEDAVAVQEVSEEVAKAGTLEVSEEVAKAATLEVANEETLEASEEVSEEVAEGVYLVAVSKRSTFFPGEVSEAESDEGLTQEEILRQAVIEEHARQQKEAAAVARSPSQDTYRVL